jgi:hypothetical protein
MANEKNLKPFKKGKDPRRNLEGRPPVLPELRETLAKILSKEKNGSTALEAVLTALFNKALKGDVRAAQELLDRYFGKVSQRIDSNITANISDDPLKIYRDILNETDTETETSP